MARAAFLHAYMILRETNRSQALKAIKSQIAALIRFTKTVKTATESNAQPNSARNLFFP